MKTTMSIPALERTIRILDLLTQAQQPLTGAEITKALNLPRSTAHGLLNQLAAAGLIRKTDERHFALGARLMYWANGFLEQQDVIAEFYQAIQHIPELDSYTLTLSTLSNDQVIYLACRNSKSPLGFEFRMGMQLPAVLTATGKIMLSYLSNEELTRLITRFPPPYTVNSVRTHSELARELTQIRRQGYAVDNGQLRLGMHCFGVAVTDHTRKARFGIAVSLIQQEANEATCKQLVAGLKKLSNRLSTALGGNMTAA